MRWAALVALALTVIAIWSAQAAAQTPGRPPFFFYGSGTPGDVITIHDPSGEELANATVGDDSTWYTSITCAAEKVPTLIFQVNGVVATPDFNQTGEDQVEITLTVVIEAEVAEEHETATGESEELSEDVVVDDVVVEDFVPEDEFSEDVMSEDVVSEDTMSEDELSEDGMTEDSMSEDSMSEDSMLEDAMSEDELSEDDDMLASGELQTDEETMYPGSGTGGLADAGAPGALTGVLVALATAAVLALGLTIRRRRGLS